MSDSGAGVSSAGVAMPPRAAALPARVTLWGRRATLLLAWCGVASGLAAVATHYWPWSFTPPVLLAAGAPLLILAAAAAPALFALARAWLPFAVSLLILATGVWTQAPLYAAGDAAATGPVVSAMQANIYYGKADAAAIARQVREGQVDVLAVEELTPAAVHRLNAAGLAQLLPYQHLSASAGAAGSGIWSRYPLRETRSYPDFNFQQLSAIMVHPQAGDIQIFALHPVPPAPRAAIWHQELGKLREILARRPAGPAIVAGDFNATHDHAPFRALLRGGLADAAEQAGAGPLRTWPTNRPGPAVISIDHLLVAGGYTKDIRAVWIPETDHKAVVARIQVRRPA